MPLRLACRATPVSPDCSRKITTFQSDNCAGYPNHRGCSLHSRPAAARTQTHFPEFVQKQPGLT